MGAQVNFEILAFEQKSRNHTDRRMRCKEARIDPEDINDSHTILFEYQLF